jgi:hypothetical protein
LREQGLIETVRIPGRRDHAVVLTKRGRELLERHRDPHESGRQTFYAGLKRSRELEHDLQVYDAYLDASDRLRDQGARIDRVVLDYELKRDYQKWLHERDAGRNDYDGHPDRDEAEIRAWARSHDLPYFDDQLHFPDLRIEYETPTAAAIMTTSRWSRFTIAERTDQPRRDPDSVATLQVRHAQEGADDHRIRALLRSC